MPISMNISSERKHTMKSLLAAISLALAFVSPAFAGIEWNFPDGSLSVGASVGTGTAAINLGAYGTGWHDGVANPWALGGVPGATGLWDLGSAGSIVLNGFSGLSSGPGLVTLKVFQWVDPGIYSGTLSFTVIDDGTTLQSGNLHAVAEIASTAGQPGAWWEYAANLNTALIDADTVTITAGSGGAIIDQLTLVPEPTTVIAGAILLIPFALSTLPILRRRRTS